MTPFAPSPPPFLYTTYHDETGIRFSFVLHAPSFWPENDDSIPNGVASGLRDRLNLEKFEIFFFFSPIIKFLFHKENKLVHVYPLFFPAYAKDSKLFFPKIKIDLLNY